MYFSCLKINNYNNYIFPTITHVTEYPRLINVHRKVSDHDDGAAVPHLRSRGFRKPDSAEEWLEGASSRRGQVHRHPTALFPAAHFTFLISTIDTQYRLVHKRPMKHLRRHPSCKLCVKRRRWRTAATPHRNTHPASAPATAPCPNLWQRDVTNIFFRK